MGAKLSFQSGAKSFSKRGSFDNLSFQSGTQTVISKGVNFSFTVGQLLQSGQNLFQSGTVTSKRSKTLLQSRAFISKGANYFQVGHNTKHHERIKKFRETGNLKNLEKQEI